jgi:hypothetical protein
VIFPAQRRIMKKRLGMRTTADRERQRRFEALLRERRRIVFKVAAGTQAAYTTATTSPRKSPFSCGGRSDGSTNGARSFPPGCIASR